MYKYSDINGDLAGLPAFPHAPYFDPGTKLRIHDHLCVGNNCSVDTRWYCRFCNEDYPADERAIYQHNFPLRKFRQQMILSAIRDDLDFDVGVMYSKILNDNRIVIEDSDGLVKFISNEPLDDSFLLDVNFVDRKPCFLTPPVSPNKHAVKSKIVNTPLGTEKFLLFLPVLEDDIPTEIPDSDSSWTDCSSSSDVDVVLDSAIFEPQSGCHVFSESCELGDSDESDSEAQAFSDMFNVGVKGDVIERWDDLTATIKDLADRVPTRQDIDDFTEAITNKIKNMGVNAMDNLQNDFLSSAKSFALLAAVLATAIKVVDEPSTKWVAAFGIASATFCLHYGISHGVFEVFLEKVKGWYSSHTLRPQAEREPQSLLSLLVSVIVNAISINTLKKVPSPKAMDSLLHRIANFKRVNDGVSDVIDWIKYAYEAIVVTFKRIILGEAYSSIVDGLDEDVINWCKSVEDIYGIFLVGDYPITQTNADHVSNLMKKGRLMCTDKYKPYEIPRVRMALATYMKTLEKVWQPFEHTNIYGAGPRMEPFTVLLRGDTGIGKSWATCPLLINLLGNVLPAEMLPDLGRNWKGMIYVRQHEHKYWDGYAGQFVCVLDDYGQVRDVVGVSDNEHMDVIRCSNAFPNMLHMAGIEQKGNTLFKSKIFFGTTNMQNFNIQSLEMPAAVERRWDFIVDTCVKSEFAIDPSVAPMLRKLDRSKIATVDGEPFRPEIYEFHVRRSRGTGDYEVYDWENFITLMSTEFLSKEEKCKQYLDQCNDMAKVCSLPTRDMSAEELLDSISVGEVIHEFAQDSDLDVLRYTVVEPMLNDFDNISATPHPAMHKLIRTRCATVSEAIGFLNRMFIYMRVKYTKAWSSIKQWEVTKLIGFLTKFYIDSIEHFAAPFVWAYEMFYAILKYKNLSSYLVNEANDRFLFRLFEKDSNGGPGAGPKTQLKMLLQNFVGWSSVFGIVAMLAPIVAYSYKKIKCLCGRELDCNNAPQSDVRQKISHGRKIRDLRKAARPQANWDQNTMELNNSLVAKSMYVVTLPNGKKIGHLLMIFDRFAILPKHFIDIIDELYEDVKYGPDSELTLTSCGAAVVYPVKLQVFFEAATTDSLHEVDLCYVYLPKYVHLHQNITKMFVTEKNLSIPSDYNVSLITCTDGKVNTKWSKARLVENKKVVADQGVSWTLKRAWAYDSGTVPGDCGAVLTLHNAGIGPGKVLGLHVAGHPKGQGFGMSAVLTCEMVTEILNENGFVKNNGVVWEVTEDVLLTAAPQSGCDLPQEFPVYGVLAKPINAPQRSKIIRSKLYGTWGTSTKSPARLVKFIKDGIEISPMRKALLKYSGVKPVPDKNTLIVSVQSAISFMCKPMHASTRIFRVLTFEEAVQGIPGVQFFEAIPRKTSAGYPYVANPVKGFSGKQFYFGKDELICLDGEAAKELKVKCEKVLSDAKMGIRSMHIFVDTLKDELRPLDKVDSGSTRLISSSPIVLTIVMRMLFLDFFAWIMQNNIKNGSAIGVDAYSEHWTQLGHYLQQKGPHLFDADFSAFDGSHSPDILRLVGEAMVSQMGFSDDLSRAALVIWSEVYSSIHVNRDIVYQWTGGLPSGIPPTTIVNTICVHAYLRYSWIRLNPNGFAGVRSFDEFVAVIAYGDDFVANVSDEIVDFYNPVGIATCLSEIGVKMTSASKGDVSADLITLKEASFLKRGFNYQECSRSFLAPLALDTILEMPYWVKRGPNLEQLMIDNFNQALRELSLHSVDVFDSYQPQMIEACRKYLNYVPPIVTQEALRLEISTHTFVL